MVLAASPILSPSVVGIYVSIALYHSYAKLVTDRSWKREDRQEKIGLGVEAAIGDASWADMILVPGEDSSTGNVTGGRAARPL